MNQKLYYFVAAAEDLNISKTAKRLFISQQALSNHIKSLEERYNTLFFERKPHLKLTVQGEHMLLYAKKVLESEQLLMKSLAFEGDGPKYRISVGVYGHRGLSIIPKVLGMYQKMHPEVQIEIFQKPSSEIREGIMKEDADIYIGSCLSNIGKYISEKLTREYIYFIASNELISKVKKEACSEFILEHQYGLRLEDTIDFPIALPLEGSLIREIFDNMYSSRNLIPKVVLETTSDDIMMEICKLNYCASFVSKQVMYKHLKYNTISGLLFFPTIDMGHMGYLGITYKKGDMPEYMEDFIACVRKAFDETNKEIDDFLIRTRL